MENKKIGEGRGVIAENPLPDDFENIHLSKADFVKKMEAKRLKEQKLKEYSRELDKEKDEKKPDTKETPGIEDKPARKGRPKKIV